MGIVADVVELEGSFRFPNVYLDRSTHLSHSWRPKIHIVLPQKRDLYFVYRALDCSQAQFAQMVREWCSVIA